MNIKKKENPSYKQILTLSLKDLKNAITPINPDMIDEEWKREIEEDRESFLRMNKVYKIEIEWDQFDEPQIQMLVALLFQSIGYSIENWHKSDRAREEGADLIVKRSKHSIAIAVKIKPKQEDRPQLIDLSNRSEKRKIYVYIQTPTKTFYNFMKGYEEKVEFWNITKLNNFFVENNLGFTTSLILDNHKISQTVREVQHTLFGIRDKCLKLRKKRTQKLDMQSFKFLWRLKDEAVSLYKTNLNVIALLERPINIKNSQLNEHFLKIFIEYFDILSSRLNSFMYYFKIFYENNKDLVHNSIISEIGKSQWLHLLQYQIDNSIPALKKDLEESIKIDRLLKESKKKFPDKDLERYWKETEKNNDIWLVMEKRVRNFMIFGCGIEEIVDDIFNEYVETLFLSPPNRGVRR